MQLSSEAPPRWWLWPTILSLDAPLVVVGWQRLLARAASTRLTGADVWVLGSSVWLAYAADRWIEGWRLTPETTRTYRHLFYMRWRWPMAVVWAAVLAADVTASVRGLSPSELRCGALLMLAVVAYLLSHQLVHRNHRWRAPKEACVAVLLGAGAAVFIAAHSGAHLRAAALPLALFSALCFSNCALISVWEHEVDRIHGQTSLALQFRGATGLAHALPWALLLACLVLWTASATDSAVAACAAASAALLGAVDVAERRTGRMPARVLADVALMTPLALLPWIT